MIGQFFSLAWGVLSPISLVDSYSGGTLQQPRKPIAIWSPKAMPYSSGVCEYTGRSLPFFSVKQKECSGLIASRGHNVPSRDESSPCLDEVAQLNDGTKHDGMEDLFSRFHLLMIYVFTKVE